MLYLNVFLFPFLDRSQTKIQTSVILLAEGCTAASLDPYGQIKQFVDRFTPLSKLYEDRKYFIESYLLNYEGNTILFFTFKVVLGLASAIAS